MMNVMEMSIPGVWFFLTVLEGIVEFTISKMSLTLLLIRF